jgi:DNA-directed RNA polymerase subunit K/omega
MSRESESLEEEYKRLATAMNSPTPAPASATSTAVAPTTKRKIIKPKKVAVVQEPQAQAQAQVQAPAQAQSQPLNPPVATTKKVTSTKRTPRKKEVVPPPVIPSPVVSVKKGDDDDDDDEPGIGEEVKAPGEEAGEADVEVEAEEVGLPEKEEEEDEEEEGEEEEEPRKKGGVEGEEGEEEEEVFDEPLEEEEGAVKKTVKKKAKNIAASLAAEVEDVVGEEEEGEVMDEDYVKRVHPEIVFPDTKELEMILASYGAKENPVIRRSKPILSKYEATSIVGMRAQQIVQGSAPLIETDLENPIDVAMAELKAKILPIIVRRIMADGSAEYWRLSELTYYG